MTPLPGGTSEGPIGSAHSGSPGESLGWAQARRLAHEQAVPLAARPVGLTEAIGCVLVEDLVAGCDLPAGDTSAMDGWAISGPEPWSVVGESLAGRSPAEPVRLAPSQAVVIATGAVIPWGATGIVRSERGSLVGARLYLREGVSGPPDLTDVRPRGREATAGDVLIHAGATVRPTTAGLAAAAGHDTLRVRPRPRVSLLVLGDELLDSGLPHGGAVRDALGVQLPAWVAELGGEPTLRIRVEDDAVATRTAVAAQQVDVVVTTGGSAAGAADHLRSTLTALRARIVVDTVDVRPGHPMLLAQLPDGRWLVGLPGNPLAALSGVVTLLEPLLAGLRGVPLPVPSHAVVEDDVPVLPHGRRSRGHLLIPVTRTAGGGVRPTGYAASSMLRGVALADGFLLVPPTGLSARQPGEVLWFPWTSVPTP